MHTSHPITCYVISLIRSDIVSGVRIRHTTLMGYVKQAILLYADRCLPSPTLVDLDYIKIMTTAVKKYEEVPKHQEMMSKGMFYFIACLACCSS